MSPNTSNNDQGREQVDPASGTHEEALGSNPYYNRAQGDAPNLDAAAPTLRSAEDQRLNRKALVFLAGIVALLILMGFLVLRKSRDDEQPPKKETQVARTATPTIPSLQSDPEPVQQTREPDAIDVLPALPSSAPQQVNYQPMPEAPERDRGPTLLERRMASTGIGSGGQNTGGDGGADQPPQPSDEMYRQLMSRASGGEPQPESSQSRRGPDVDDVSSASFINHPDALLVRGTYLRCVLETRIITDVPGFTSCLLTEPVYSINGRSLLLPKGSKIYGSYGGGPTGKRVSVIWDRITTPNGIDVAMSSPGVDQLGGAGHPGQYSAHWGSRITSALMISMLADIFKYAAAENGPETTTITGNGLAIQQPYESSTARTMERLAGEALNENMRRPPTVTINQGVVVNVYVAKDVDFTAVLARRR
ncbi:TrbI/VirB10 family protein [Xanthomonas campestris pv. raphani]|uniref:TrbI/VirB10 family protein n=1 Tax=Xanthomonas campestris TaxID=339 RepID=UPI00021AF897|nr:TrbI/VirB10 family protein [Xanthomonas campestris]AEL07682.1 VirB10 protein [Xanthomonas campestris pv. raphani 756C]MEA9675846.1 TrbI/VirB10 family protein [Xanthomonas campestris pv. raphani]MEA9755522.1 TrbI/VirB10 family protein [Xanthomonas campestris pv. raphani]MEA9761979.1 TrbI/VirB10 family protein [Xanthomonas campestris pv. raphani]MEA9776853.1 TrbI/VirB10 family protein [Xanthomonas campestris pv. raphani]